MRYVFACLDFAQKASAALLLYVAGGAFMGYALQLHPPFVPTCVFDTMPAIDFSYCPAESHKLLWFLALGIPSYFVTATAICWITLAFHHDSLFMDLESSLLQLVWPILCLVLFGPGIRFWWRRHKRVAIIACLATVLDVAALGRME